MQSVVKSRAQPGALVLEGRDVVGPGPGEVAVKVPAAGICGTDLAIEDWPDWIRSRMRTPVTIGHEALGVVQQVGAGVDHLNVGDKVGIETHIFCGSCHNCLNGQQHICQFLTYVGMHSDGVFSPHAVLPASLLFKLPQDFPDDLGTLLEPFGLALRGASGGGGCGGRTVFVTGCGPIGLMACIAARHFGAHRVVASEISPYRLKFARRHAPEFGIDRVVDAGAEDVVGAVRQATGGVGADLWIDFAGGNDVARQGYEATRPGGRAHLFAGGQPLALDPTRFVLKEVTTRGFHGRLIFETWIDAVRVAPEVAAALRLLITHTLPLNRYEQGFALARSGNAMKVVFEMEGSHGGI